MRDRKSVMKNNILTGPLFFIGNDKIGEKQANPRLRGGGRRVMMGGVSGKTGTARGAE